MDSQIASRFWKDSLGHYRLILPPTHHVSASLTDIEDIRFSAVTPEQLGFTLSPDTVLAREILEPVQEGIESYNDTFSQLCSVLDQIATFYPVSKGTSETDKEQLLQSYHDLFIRLANPALLPAYHALNPHFFVWLSGSDKRADTPN